MGIGPACLPKILLETAEISASQDVNFPCETNYAGEPVRPTGTKIYGKAHMHLAYKFIDMDSMHTQTPEAR